MITNIEDILSEQIGLNKNKNLLYRNPGEILKQDPSFTRKLEELRESENNFTNDDLEKLVDYAANELIRKVYEVNQFINILDAKKEEVKNIYRESWKVLKNCPDIGNCLREYHYPKLSRWLASLYPASIKDALNDVKEIGNIICEEYSPEFQCEILKLNPGNLIEPVIDVGCGENGNLVKHLRKRGVDIIGIDRLIKEDTAFLLNCDWLKFSFKNKKWGTVISNAAISNHIIYAYKYDRGLLELYRQKYMEIINSLKVGGEFIYAPGIKIFEDEIGNTSLEIQNYKITNGYFLTKIKRISV